VICVLIRTEYTSSCLPGTGMRGGSLCGFFATKNRDIAT
jgi:hypothetical protein